MNLIMPKVGQRIKLVRDYDYDTGFCGRVPAGETGVIVSLAPLSQRWDSKEPPPQNEPPAIRIKLDTPFDVEDNIISFYEECGPLNFNGMDIEDICLQFHLCCEFI